MTAFALDTFHVFCACVLLHAVLDAMFRACLLIGDVLTEQRETSH